MNQNDMITKEVGKTVKEKNYLSRTIHPDRLKCGALVALTVIFPPTPYHYIISISVILQVVLGNITMDNPIVSRGHCDEDKEKAEANCHTQTRSLHSDSCSHLYGAHETHFSEVEEVDLQTYLNNCGYGRKVYMRKKRVDSCSSERRNNFLGKNTKGQVSKMKNSGGALLGSGSSKLLQKE
ncbi:hypothetical protein Bpfe_004932 [Biomphalaria pfeifferi]|uniref:Uncharacterized protein n=1 Tax=Biomphalaria pfeifferi TaxID=112525 RepID=A0AAD8C4R5_BIOPF|nr:hypothetical protein Bpfe_004932 [Biomphalaria pfeifferi]